MLANETTEATIDEEVHSQVQRVTANPDKELPPLLMRQFKPLREKWKRHALLRIWFQRDHAYEIAEDGGVPALMDHHDKIRRRRVMALDPRGSLAELVTLLFDRVCASEGVLPVVVVDLRGVFVVNLPAVQP